MANLELSWTQSHSGTMFGIVLCSGLIGILLLILIKFQPNVFWKGILIFYVLAVFICLVLAIFHLGKPRFVSMTSSHLIYRNFIDVHSIPLDDIRKIDRITGPKISPHIYVVTGSSRVEIPDFAETTKIVEDVNSIAKARNILVEGDWRSQVASP